ncbi:MAG TPA: DUF5011 domain-containing protein [Patescibacteria group bacterium]|nr:DUF5011 domain-containing protein [Patescibacteria group bacterium]
MKKIIVSLLGLVFMFGLAGVANAYDLNGIDFNADYNPDQGYVAYIQPYDAENKFHKLSPQKIEQYGNPGDAPLGPWVEGQWFDFEYGKAFGGGESQNWVGQNYIVTYWWNNNEGEYIPMNGPGGDIYIYQPVDGLRPMGILYQGEWKLFDAGTNGLSGVRGENFWWDLSDAGVAEGDTIEALAWWSNTLGWPGLLIEKKFPDNHKEQYPGPTAIDMNGDGSTEALTFLGGGTPMSYHDPFYMGIKYAELILPDTTPPVITLVGPDTINLFVGDTYTDLGATAFDNVDGDITDQIMVGGDTVDTNTPGTYVITYNVKDVAGNPAGEVVRTVIVSVLSKADILIRSGVPGNGLENAPGLQKPFNPNSQAGQNAGKKK